jgi:hypothetical protein
LVQCKNKIPKNGINQNSKRRAKRQSATVHPFVAISSLFPFRFFSTKRRVGERFGSARAHRGDERHAFVTGHTLVISLEVWLDGFELFLLGIQLWWKRIGVCVVT